MSVGRHFIFLGSLLVASCVSIAQAAEFPGLGPKGSLQRIAFENETTLVLPGANARLQLLVTGHYDSGQAHDLTSGVTYSSNPEGIVAIASSGLVRPLANGTTTVTARTAEGLASTLQVTTDRCEEELRVNFVEEVVPIFTKLGCNAGGCHGKADGQNGFKLSLLGFYPEDDYEYLVHEDRGRRLFPADPEFSLLLLKPSNQMPHGGGQRMTPGSYEWDLMATWIRQGMPYTTPEDPTLKRIEVLPPVREMNFGTAQQLSVVAHYSDGSRRDVTRLASYEANVPEMAETDATGRVTVGTTPGEVAVMARFQGEVTVFRAVLPQGLPVASLPPSRGFVDDAVFAKLKQLGIPPSDLSDDATFLRRATIDIAGRLPTPAETETFLANTSSDKRTQLIDRLIASDAYADYFANKWSALLRNKRRNDNDRPYTYRFHAWIRRALQENMPFDQFVRSILTAAGDVETHPPVAWFREVKSSTEQMEDTAQLFLGMRMACAKCHHHPFERWSQQDYYGFEAFFTQVATKTSRYNPQQNDRDVVVVQAKVPASRNPRTGLDVPPTGLGDAPLEIPAYQDARQDLANWMTQQDNPYFAKALVNRYWKHFFGRGIVAPEDDLRTTNPPTNPELLNALAADFVQSGYDLKHLVRTICTSSTYQLSSNPSPLNENDQQNFSSFYPRRLSAEVLYDAVDVVSGSSSNFGGIPRGTTAVQLPDSGFNNYFLQVFGRPEAESACECERIEEANLSQSLHLLNSNDVQGRVQQGDGIVAMLAADETRSIRDGIRDLYVLAYSRPPTEEEEAFVKGLIEPAENKRQAFEDLVWALINSKEFQFVR